MFEMKSWCVVLLVFWANGYNYAQYISEFHYDNIGTDVDEFIEIVLPHPQPEDLENYRIYNYNGSDSMVYLSRSLSGLVPNCPGDSCFYVWTRQQLLQNGPDGIALVYHNETDTLVFDFISYEGEIKALDGPARGMVSMDVGVFEDGDTPIGWSLQRDSTGTWFAGPATPGSINPIELLSFSGQYLDVEEVVRLDWVTVSETNNMHFIVQRSSDQVSFLPIGTLDGGGTRQDTLMYTYVDEEPPVGYVYYRLQQVDMDGSTSYSNVIEVYVPRRGFLGDLVPIFKNWDLSFVVDDFEGLIDVRIYDSLGRLLHYHKDFHPNGVITFQSPVYGIVFYHLKSGSRTYTGSAVVMD